MTIYFANDGVLDLDTIRVMGASIKGEGAIGFFGTGLKFAIATLLRTGHDISIQIEGEFHSISSRSKLIRGQEFQVVCLDGEELGYTTELGKNWEPWQAYRELASNNRDERNGIVTPAGLHDDFDTVIMVSGDGIERAYAERHTIFTEAPVLYSTGDIEIRQGANKRMFYRGIRVAEIGNAEALYTYNILTKQDLTEDRTLAQPYYAGVFIAQAFLQCTDEDIIESAVLAEKGTMEQGISWTQYGTPGATWMRVVERNRESAKLSSQAREHWYVCEKDKSKTVRTMVMDAEDKRMLAEARKIAKMVDKAYREDAIYFVEDLGAHVLGRVIRGEVMISRGAFQSTELLAGTLLEEYFHLHLGHYDESRAFQNFLINRMIDLAKRAK